MCGVGIGVWVDVGIGHHRKIIGKISAFASNFRYKFRINLLKGLKAPGNYVFRFNVNLSLLHLLMEEPSNLISVLSGFRDVPQAPSPETPGHLKNQEINLNIWEIQFLTITEKTGAGKSSRSV